MKVQCRAAVDEDCIRIMEIINQAKVFLKESGVDQWQSGYPDEDCIKTDIIKNEGYLLTVDDEIAGYLCISFDQEESYLNITGRWKSNKPYAVIHRMTIDSTYRGQGLAVEMLSFAETMCLANGIHSIKIDTDDRNEKMKGLLRKNGYEYCGIIIFDESEKVAFEKIF